MTNRFRIYYDCGIDIPDLYLQFEGTEPIHLTNHSSAEVDLEPGSYTLYAGYRMVVGDTGMDFMKKVEVIIEEGFDYTAKICMVLKSFTLLKRIEGSGRCC